MGEPIPEKFLPPYTQFEWGTLDGAPVIHAIHINDGQEGGIFSVRHHLLSPDVETPILLRAAGMSVEGVAGAMHASQVATLRRGQRAFDVLGVPPWSKKENERLPMAISRLCLPGSVLEVVQPISFCMEPDALSLKALRLIAEGKAWRFVVDACGLSRRLIHERIEKWYTLQNGTQHSVPRLLHVFGSGHLDPEEVAAAQSNQKNSQKAAISTTNRNHRLIPEHLLPPHTRFEWGSLGDHVVVDRLFVADGELKVCHGVLPPHIETPLILKVAGVDPTILPQTEPTGTRWRLRRGVDLLGTPALRSEKQQRLSTRLRPAVARLFLPGGVVEVVRQISFAEQPPEKDIALLRLLGLGNAQEKIADKAARESWRRTRKWHNIQSDTPLWSPWLLRGYWSGLLDPEEVVAEQERLRQLRAVQAYRPPASRSLRLPGENAPESFTLFPFEDDLDARIHIIPGATFNTSHIQFVEVYEGTTFDVAKVDTILTSDNRRSPINEREKLALILCALGATYDEVDTYCLKPSQLKKFGIHNSRQATLAACRTLLISRTEANHFLELSPRVLEATRLLVHAGSYREIMEAQGKSLSDARVLSAQIRHFTKIHDLRSANLLLTLAHAKGELV